MSEDAPRPGDASQSPGCHAAREAFGALILEDIDPGARMSVEAHVGDCDDCASLLADLLALSVRVRDVSAGLVVPPAAPAAVFEHALSRVRAERAVPPAESLSRRRWPLLVAAVAAAVAVTVAVLVLLPGREAGRLVVATPVSVSATDPATSVAASVTLTPSVTGTDVRLTVNGVEPGAQCDIVIVARDGSSDVAASWLAGYVGTAEVNTKTAIPADQIARVDVTSPTDGTLVSLQIPA